MPVGLLSEIASTFNISAGHAGLMMIVPALLAAISAPSVMVLAQSIDRKKILLILSAILLCACVLSAWAPTFEVMLMGRALVGVSLGAFWAMGVAVAGRLVSKDDITKATATVFAGVSAAMIVGVPLGTLIGEMASWRAAFMGAAVLALIALAMQLITLPKLPADQAIWLT